MHTLRPYQQTAKEKVLEDWQDCTSTLVVLPTGCGKTVLFSALLKERQKRSIVIAHRGELIYQAAKHIKNCGLEVDIEMANMRADSGFWNPSVIIATVQTLASERINRFDPNDFETLICDEAHHATSPSYRKVFDHFKQNKNLKILGVTATPDRADESALGQVFESVAFDYEILNAIEDGWLVPIKQQMVEVEGLDFSQMRTTAGDLNGADLSAVMEAEKTLHGVASASLDIVGERRTIVFATSVRHAEMLCNIYNRHRQGMAGWVHGGTDKEERKELLDKFSKGGIQVVVNVGVLTEGFDNPGVTCIVQARPTKSRCLYSQMIGRATRPLSGIVDLYPTAEERRAAIAASTKPEMLVLDFAGNAGRHKLVTTADILGGDFEDEEIELAERTARKSGKPVDMTEELEKARQELLERKRRAEATKAKLVAKAKFTSVSIDPFNAFQISAGRERGWETGKRLSDKQRSILMKQGIDPDQLGYHKGKAVLNELFRRWDGNLCSLKQANCLNRFGYDTKNMTMKQAGELITALKNNNWKRI